MPVRNQPQGQQPVTPQRIMQFSFGYAMPLMLEAAVRLRVFDVLDGGSKTIEQVSKETGASVRGLKAIMNALVGFEFLTKNQDRYGLAADTSVFLVKGKPAYYGDLIRHTTNQLLINWMKLTDVVASGKPAAAVNQEPAGSTFFHEFVESLFPLGYPSAQMLGQELKVSQTKTPITVLDLAAGSGVWGIALAELSPNVKVTAVDWPGVLDVTRRVATRRNVADRYTFTAGDLQTADFGSNHRIATLGHILHSEGVERSRSLLKKTFKALAPGGTIAVAEMVVDQNRMGPPHALIFAVNMLVNTDQGDTFSFEEISGWLKEAGFIDARLLQTPSPSPLILATKPA
jgi:2-polyprenyl-3-methyl-5-hydroxy-6-metoxy-1,4-benzoquinol methylase